MSVFIYKAVTKNGQLVRNKVEEFSKNALLKRLKRNELMPISVVQIRTKTKNNKAKKNIKRYDSAIETANAMDIRKKITSRKKSFMGDLDSKLRTGQKPRERDLMIFTQNFYLLKKANFNNIHALSTIIETTENESFKAILEDILVGVESGENIYTTMEYYDDIFPYIYINLIRVGELSGTLEKSLKQAIDYLEESSKMKKKLRSILLPNILMFGGIFVMLILGTIVAIPAIQGIFNKVGSTEKMPAVTIWFSNFIDMIMKYWYIPTFIVIGIVVGIISYVKTPKGRYNFHHFKYKMPIFGKLIYSIDFSRFIRAVVINIENGTRIQDALEVSKKSSKNLELMSMIEAAINNTLIGQSWIEPFENSGLSSAMVTEMLKVGMQTDLAEMMNKLLEYIDIDIQNSITKIMKILPQIVYIFVGIVLIFFILVVLVPVMQLYMGNWMFSAFL